MPSSVLYSPFCLLHLAHFFHAPYLPGHGVCIWVSALGLFANPKRGARYLMIIQMNKQKWAGRNTSLTSCFSLERFIIYDRLEVSERSERYCYQVCLCV